MFNKRIEKAIEGVVREMIFFMDPSCRGFPAERISLDTDDQKAYRKLQSQLGVPLHVKIDFNTFKTRDLLRAIKQIGGPSFKVLLLKDCLNKDTELGKCFFKNSEDDKVESRLECGVLLKEICDLIKSSDPTFVKPPTLVFTTMGTLFNGLGKPSVQPIDELSKPSSAPDMHNTL